MKVFVLFVFFALAGNSYANDYVSYPSVYYNETQVVLESVSSIAGNGGFTFQAAGVDAACSLIEVGTVEYPRSIDLVHAALLAHFMDAGNKVLRIRYLKPALSGYYDADLDEWEWSGGGNCKLGSFRFSSN